MQLTLDFTEIETWKPIPGFEGYYEVSNAGQIKSLERVVLSSNGRRMNVRERIRKANPNAKSGYLQVGLYIGGVGTLVYVHEAVAAAHIGPRPEGMEILHADGTRDNNHVSNLSYGTRSENMYDRVAHGRHPQASKTHCIHGHEFTEENTRRSVERTGSNRRRCRTCKRLESRRYRQRNIKTSVK